MADVADSADLEIEARNRLSASKRKPAGPRATGKCLDCNAPLAPGLRWCDAICRDEWEAEQRRKGLPV